MAERLANLGYLGMKKESTAGTAVTPDDYVPLYESTLGTNMNFVDQQPIFGNKFATFNTLQSSRSHKGDLTVLAEPNTTARLFDMLLTKTSTSGSSPYTHVFDLTGDSNSYTIDVSTGNVVSRFFGVKASKITPNWNKTEMQWKLSVSALGSFQGRALASTPTGTGPYSVVLSTAYDPSPTTGLVVSDLVRFYKADGTTIDATVAAITDGTTFTTSVDVTGLAADDIVYLRPATISFTLLDTFIWPKTKFQFADTAANALSASQTRLEEGSTYEIMHSFESDDGAARSGAFDPAALVRTTGDATFNRKSFFDKPLDIADMNALTTTAAAILHLSGATNQYRVGVTLHQLKTDGSVFPTLKSGDVTYSEINYHTDYNQTDGKGYSITVINELASV